MNQPVQSDVEAKIMSYLKERTEYYRKVLRIGTPTFNLDIVARDLGLNPNQVERVLLGMRKAGEVHEVSRGRWAMGSVRW